MPSLTRSSNRFWACREILPAGSFERACCLRSMTETIAGSLLFLRLESTAGRKRRGPAKPAPQSIPSPLVRHLVAWVAPSAVLRASAEIVGRRASLTRQLTPKRGRKHRGRKDHEVDALRGPHGVSATRGLARRHREALPRAGWRNTVATRRRSRTRR